MDGSRFDAVVRLLGSEGSRRPLLGAGLAALAASGLSVAQPSDSEGKGKGKKKKKKKKCKGNTKKCGKKCIPADQCCSSADCGNGGQCTSGKCSCPVGQKSCKGGCIPQSACCATSDCGSAQTCVNGACTCPPDTKACGTECLPPIVCCSLACPGDQTCENGVCTCDNPLQSPCADGSCVAGSECCVDSQCPEGQECVDGTCWCAGDGILCDDVCCNAGEDQVCLRESVTYTCENGGCGTADWCVDPGEAYCSFNAESWCVCQVTKDGASSCLDRADLGSPAECRSCASDGECGQGYVCVNEGEFCNDCGGAFCALTCEGAATLRTPHRSNVAAAERSATVSKRKKR